MKQLLMFILFASTLCWLMFAPVYKHVIITRQALLQKEADYLLEVGASGRFGYIDPRMIEQSRERLKTFGFQPEKLVYLVSTTNGEDGMNRDRPILRGEGLGLEIQYPYQNLLAIDRLIGITVPSEQLFMEVKGLKMSEFVP